MSDVPCRVTYDLNQYQSSLHDCECADNIDRNDMENLCKNCFYNHPDYFEED